MINVTFKYVSDKVQDLAITVGTENFVGLDKLVLAVKINIPEDNNDRLFQREILRTVVDIGKLLNGVYGNPIIKSVVDSITSKKGFNTSFPVTPVRTSSKSQYNSQDIFFQKNRTYENFTISSHFAPVPFDTRSEVNLRFTTKVTGKKKSQFLANMWFRGGIKH